MATINFKRGDIFKQGINHYDLCILYGHDGMAFGHGLHQMIEDYAPMRTLERPFEENPNELIFYEENRALVLVPKDYMSDKELEKNLNHWLTTSDKQNFSSIALTGVRNSVKTNLNAEEGAKNDDQRVAFIVCFLQKWLIEHRNKTGIKDIMLIAMSDNFTRNFSKPIIIGE